MRVLLDMPVSGTLVETLRRRGHEAVHALALGLARAPDREALDGARRDGRLGITPFACCA